MNGNNFQQKTTMTFVIVVFLFFRLFDLLNANFSIWRIIAEAPQSKSLVLLPALFVQQIIILFRHSSAFKLEPYITHSVLTDLSPCIRIVVVNW